MALDVKKYPRQFQFKKDSKTVTLPDPNRNFIPEEVMSFYANTYPELTNAVLEGPKIENEHSVFDFKLTVGTKG